MREDYRFLYRDGQTLFFEHCGKEVSAMLDDISEAQFNSLKEAFPRGIPAPLLESAVIFNNLRFDLLTESGGKYPGNFKKAVEYGISKGYRMGYKAAESLYVEERKVDKGTGRACGVCGTYQSKKECTVCGMPTWKMKKTEAWFYGFREMSESARVEVIPEKNRIVVTEDEDVSEFEVQKENVRVLNEIVDLKEETVLRFTRSKGVLVESRWTEGFGLFSRKKGRIDPLDMRTESVQVNKDNGKVVVKFVESGRKKEISRCCTDRFVEAMSRAKLSSRVAAGLSRMSELTSSVPNVPISPLSSSSREKLLRKIAGDLGVVEYDPKKGMAAIAIPRKKARVCTPLKEITSIEDMEILDSEDPEYEEASELAVAVGVPNPTVKASCEMIAVVIPVALIAVEKEFSEEEERLLDTASDGEEHLVNPVEEGWHLESSKKALDGLEKKGFVERTSGNYIYRLTETGRLLFAKGD